MTAQTFTLPMPPTSNNLYAHYEGGRFKTQQYSDWIIAAGWQLRIQKPFSINGEYHLEVEVSPPRGDRQNRLKAISDLLVKHGVVEDDSLERTIRLSPHPTESTTECRVTVTPCEA